MARPIRQRRGHPDEGGASLEAAKRTRREMARAESRWSDEEMR